MLASIMVISRSLYLRLKNWETLWALIGSLIVTEIAVGLHYLPLSPIQNGITLVGSVYIVTSIVMGIKDNRQGLMFWMESALMSVLLILISLIWV
jgi:hypothetical protein